MKESKEKERTDEPQAVPRLTRLQCRRTGEKVDLAEHARCPYCFGELELPAGRHEAFCDYRPGVDPLAFGFPPDTSRQRSG